MLIKDSYFEEAGGWPTVELWQGYLTRTDPVAQIENLEPYLSKAAEEFPEILDCGLCSALSDAVAREERSQSFEAFCNIEVSFDGEIDCGPSGDELDIAFSKEMGIALVAYVGRGVPLIVKRYACSSPDEAVDLWLAEAAEPLMFADGEDDDETAASNRH
ncbi:hypothetical protein [Rhizobium tubonense]|uniref:Uncharacterized protein n=1 Tax=Rhizobium tubonense TaxID=484088 RepID=A0A2W4DYF9_9HYPH|nr:hypothetical protein [Rhizobium tubonense]PZM08846.1 hypothetical protein CPY51_28185 [Rhizobium tubonense]